MAEVTEITNAFFAKNSKTFIKACKKADIPPTSRQASKFRRKMGLAYSTIR